MFDSLPDLSGKLASTGYFIDPVMIQVVFLAAKLHKPLLLEGTAGSGKTQLGLSIAAAASTDVERLQCYRGMTEDKAIGRFDEGLQRVYMEFSNSQNWEKAKTTLEFGLRSDPSVGEAHFLLALNYFRQQKPTASLAEYTLSAASRLPTAAEFRTIGADYVLLGALGDADKWFTRATQEAPESADGWYLLGRTKYMEGQLSQAVDCFRRTLDLREDDVIAEDNLGLSHKALSRTAEARKAFGVESSWQYSTSDRMAGPSLNSGMLLLEENKPEEASRRLRDAVIFSPNDPKAHEQLGRALRSCGDSLGASKEFHESAELAPDSSAIHFELG